MLLLPMFVERLSPLIHVSTLGACILGSILIFNADVLHGVYSLSGRGGARFEVGESGGGVVGSGLWSDSDGFDGGDIVVLLCVDGVACESAVDVVCEVVYVVCEGGKVFVV